MTVEVQGHRGNRALRPENTLPAFSTAIEVGADVLELDILATQDNKLVIHHDFFISKEKSIYSDGTPLEQEVLVRSLSLENLQKLDVGSKVDPHFPFQKSIPGTKIPALQDLFDLIHTSSHPNAKKIRLNLELKRDLRFPEWTMSPMDLAKAIVQQVKENGLEDRVYYSSFDPEVLAAIRKVDPSAVTGFIVSSQSVDVAKILHPDAGMDLLLQIAKLLQVTILSPDHELLQSKEDVASLHEKGFRVIPWTVNDPKRWQELIDMGVDGVISDDPQGLLRFLKTHPAP